MLASSQSERRMYNLWMNILKNIVLAVVYVKTVV